MYAIEIPDPPPLDSPGVVALGYKAFDRALIGIPGLIELGNVNALDGGRFFQEISSSFPLGSGLIEASQELREDLFPLTDEKGVEEIGEGLWIEKNGHTPRDCHGVRVTSGRP